MTASALDLDLVVGDQLGADEGVGRSDVAETAAVGRRHRVPLIEIAKIDPCAHHVSKRAAQRLDAGGDLVEEVNRLAVRIAPHTTAALPWVAVVPLTRMRLPIRTAR